MGLADLKVGLYAVGALCVAVGIGLVFIPAALIAVGISCLAAVWLLR